MKNSELDREKDHLKARIRDLELTLGQNDDNLAVTFRLTPVLNNLLGLLLSVPNVTPEMIRQRLEIAPDAKVAIHRLRKQLEPWKIEIHSKRNVGYWLDNETKAAIRAQVLGVMGPAATPEVTTTITARPDEDDLSEAA